MRYLVHHGELPAAFTAVEGKFHAVLCDPPYSLSFMNKKWDSQDVPYQDWTRAWATALLPLLHPGALMFCFGGTRTWHRLASGLEDAGLQMWDTLMWLHGQGFPKAQKIGTGEWAGYKTCALKPAWEPVLCFRAPSQGKRYLDLAQSFGSGALNVDGGRIAGPRGDGVWGSSNATCKPTFNDSQEQHEFRSAAHDLGRYPANVALDEETAAMLDDKSGTLTSGANPEVRHSDITRGIYGEFKGHECFPRRGADSGGASRFFYTAKADNSERHGLNEATPSRNTHPTIKPVALCRWLATLLLPPKSVKPRRLLIPFCGSGSEMIGALQAGWDEVVGIDQDAEYCKLVPKRIEHHVGLFAEMEIP